MILFWNYQKLSQLDPGVKISYDILTPSRYFHPPVWQSFICLSYLLEKMYYYSKIILMIFLIIYDAFILHYQHII